MSTLIKINKYPRLYVNYISGLFFLAYGFVMLDANGITFFSDVLMKELGISASQYSNLNAVVWSTKALSSIIIGAIADRTGLRKVLVVPLLYVAGLLSILVSFANSYVLVLLLRFVWGFCVGATMSMLVSIISNNLIKNDLGARSGFMSTGSAVIASTLGPIILTQIVLRYSWRAAFIFTGGIIIFIAIIMHLTVSEVHCEKNIPQPGKKGLFLKSVSELMHYKSFVLCLIIGVFECAAKLTLTIFGPLYLTEIMNITTAQKGTLLSIMGLLYIPVSFIIPALADKFGGKRVMFVTFVICSLSPLGMILFEGKVISVWTYVLFGNWAAATVSIFIYLIPGQDLPKNLIGTANGIIMGVSVFFGGCVCPLILGHIANSVSGLNVITSICLIMFIICLILTALLDSQKKRV